MDNLLQGTREPSLKVFRDSLNSSAEELKKSNVDISYQSFTSLLVTIGYVQSDTIKEKGVGS